MGPYILRRLLLAVPVVFGTLTVLFLAFFVVPGDPVQLMSGERTVSPQMRANIEERLGLDQPWYVQYGQYWSRLAHGDLGESFTSRRSVTSILADTAPSSLRLAFWALLIEVVIGVGVGVLSAARRYSLADTATTVATTIVLGIPVFVLGYLLVYGLSVFPFQHGFPRWAQLKAGGIGPDRWALGVIPLGDQWRYLLLPAVTLAAVQAVVLARLTRSSMLDVLGTDYLRTARAGGLTSRTVLLKHGLKNAMVPIVTLIGLDLATFFGAAIVTETVFSWPGIGSRVAGAASSLDAPIVLGLTLVIVLAYVVINLLVDVSYALLDPRIRYGRTL
ncbi:MAG: ABC transporter permease [Acidimicrobiales bacterium]